MLAFDFAVDVGDMLVGQQDHDEVGVFHRIGQLLDFQAGLFRLVPGRAALAQANRDLDPGILEIQRMGMALRTVAEDGDFFALDQTQVGVLVVENFHVCLVGLNA